MGKISIVGLGPGDYSLISQGALYALSSSSNVYLRTKKHPTVDQLKEIAEYKLPDLNCDDVEAAMKIVAGSARNMGIAIDE